ncbi:extracellular solute-binding protein [Cohnella thailandensis]|uniref:Extracellular solute-binding protein n=1 Tax=Cohnella thailandensis TaxID=557557 RepID=A0A841SVJ4_9BACL|nr:extracellular solute-binding protein [Cohnella thailandensis]MBB6634626.1 extracellular solute-binding protein [Cohnella thailandensis]MBP1972818.1 putative aldouronate transport system substrate-binding protein [Cohnella thailandensis]
MKKKAKIAASILAMSVGIASLAACSSNNGNSEEASPSPSSSSPALNIVDGKIDHAVTITTVRGEDPTATFKNGENYSDNVHTRWARDTLGVDIKTLWTSPTGDGSYDTKLKLMLSSGDKLPDIFVSTQQETTSMFIESGKVMDVSEAFEKYASATWKAALAETPTAWQPFMKDGKKYAIPVIRQNMGTQSPLWIRQDWLTKLNLQAPTTLEELEKVMDAFVNQDPDGNGKKDTVALDFGMKDAFLGYPIGDTSWIFGMFGAIPERWYPGEDGKLQYGSIQPGIKNALTKLKEWKDKGYIATDIALHDFNKVAETVAAGKVGMLGGENWLMVYPGSLMLASNPTAMYVPYTLPTGEGGQKTLRTIGVPYTSAILISKDITDEALQAFFHYQNTLYTAFESDDPFLFKGFQEGYDYVIKDGKADMSEQDIPGGKAATMKYTLTGAASIYPSKTLATDIKIAKGEELTGSDLASMATTGIIGVDATNPLELITRQATLVAMEQTDSDVPEYFLGSSTDTMSSRNELLKKMQMDTFTNIIYGKASPDEFDSFVKKWKSSGGDDITKEVNEWYDSVKQ